MTPVAPVDPIETSDAALLQAIQASSGASPVETVLRTDQRVLARVTDGIYRQPGSAIRELISNSYDADATRVIIKTDRPRFNRISVEDDGSGMSAAAITHLVRHIGGSAKRTSQGIDLGVTNPDDPTRSPGGRKLIGKIGIGLFSVAQLTERFQIITKIEAEDFRTVATVVLKHFVDDDHIGDNDVYEAGRVNIWREPASDLSSHGTTIVLTDIRPQTRETLQTLDHWAAIDADAGTAPEESRDLKAPRFHIGRVDQKNPDLLRSGSSGYDSLPWDARDAPEDAFRKLVLAVWTEADRGTGPNPQLERIFDYYLRMVWQLSLAAPAPYVEGNPFDILFGDSIYAFQLPRDLRLPPNELTLTAKQTLRTATGLEAGSSEGEDFEILFDDIRLLRPLRFRGLPKTSHKVTKPIMLVSRCREEFEKMPREFSGGPLEFEAYLMWAPKIAPVEHQGALIRIHGSSGTLFDPTFLRYQVSEQTRLRQITCEIFVRAGLEGALNIDRESFNYSHPHVVYITKWLHVALRRLATVQKRIAADLRDAARRQGEEEAEERLDGIVAEVWRRESDDEGQSPPEVEFLEPGVDDPLDADNWPSAPDGHGGYRYSRSAVFGRSAPSKPDRRARVMERKLRAIVQLLAAFRFLDALTESEQERLFSHLREILEAADE